MKIIAVISFLVVSFFCKAQELNSTQQNIAKLIITAYAEGLQNEGDTAKIDAGFHPSFKMIYKDNANNLNELSLSTWRNNQIERKSKGDLPRTKETEVSLTFDFIDVTQDVAVAKVNYFEGGKMTYIDYISLYKFEDGWKIISKIFHKIQ